MIFAMIAVIAMGLVAILIATSIVPSNFRGLGLEAVGGLISFMVFWFVLYRAVLLGKHFGFKDNGGEEDSFIGKIWLPLSLTVAMACAYISAMVLM